MSELLKINVNEHVEKKGSLSYLSWAWAWAEVLKIDPKATWRLHRFGTMDELQPCMWIGETAMVHVTVTINDIQRDCVLPVMDNRNKAIKNPDAFAINTAIMRCLAKAIAMHGLGLYIYAGEDLPEGEPPSSLEDQLKASIDAAKAKKNNRPPRNDGVPWERVDELESLAADMLALQEEGREIAAAKAYYGLPSNEEKLIVWGFLKGPGGGSTPESRLRAFIKANNPHEQVTT